MNESENKFDSTAGSGMEALRSEVQSLRTMLSFTLLLMFVFSFCVNIFLFRQASAMSAQANEAQMVVGSFENGGAAQAIDFWNKLNDYARTHADFAPIINKYSRYINVHTNAPAAKKK